MKHLSRLRYELLLAVWPLGKYTRWLRKVPLLGRLFAGQTGPGTNETIILPTPSRRITIRHEIEDVENIALPYPLLAPLLEQASARTILNECPCRRAERCATYPPVLGCLFLGDGAAQIHPQLGRPATPGEAWAHVKRAMDAGLVPTVLHSAFDAYLLDIPYRRMLAICFCCDCCCTVRLCLDVDAPGFRDTVIRLPGLTLEIDVSCTGCGACLAACPVRAISLTRRTRARIDPELCKGCGRCRSACPSSAIRWNLADQAEMQDLLLARIAQRTDIGVEANTSQP